MIVWMALAGGLGAVCRFVVDGEVRARAKGALPVATLLINLVGALVLGLVTGLVMHHGTTPVLRSVVGTGFCGGFTTFSTAMVETVRLLQTGARHTAAAYLVATVVGGLTMAALGLAVA